MEGVVNEQERIASNSPPPSITEQAMFRREEIQQLVERLKEPFDPRVVQWVVTATAGSKDGHRRGLLAAYADPRAYMDRLNQLLTPSGWTQEYSTQVVANCPRKVRDKQAASAKLLVVCRLTVFGLGVHSGTGEGWADDENALTSADAQAFKRARRVLRSRPLLLRSTADMGGSGRARSSKVVAGVAGVGPAAGDARQGEWKRRS